MSRARLFCALVAAAFLTACQMLDQSVTGTDFRLSIVKGVEGSACDPRGCLLTSASGIAVVDFYLPPNSRQELQWQYAPGKPFRKIEGVQIQDQARQQPLSQEDAEAASLLEVEGNRVRLKSGDDPLLWQLRVIDFYR